MHGNLASVSFFGGVLHGDDDDVDVDDSGDDDNDDDFGNLDSDISARNGDNG